MDRNDSRYKWFVVCLLASFLILNYAVRWALQSVFPLLQTEMALNDEQKGWLLFGFGAAYGLCSPFVGAMADRFGKRAVVFGSLIAWSGICAATPVAKHFHALLLFRI